MENFTKITTQFDIFMIYFLNKGIFMKKSYLKLIILLICSFTMLLVACKNKDDCDLDNDSLTTKQTYTVTYDSDGGTSVAAQSGIEFANKATKPANPTKVGYDFDGWYYQGEKWSFIGYSVTENITLTAQWKVKEYTIDYNLDGGNLENKTSTYTIESEDIVLSTPTKTSFEFDGWYNNPEFSGNAITIIESGNIGDITLYAKWNALTSNLTLDANGGNCTMSSIDVTVGQAMNLPIPTKQYYVFAGWEANGTIFNSTTIWQNNTNITTLTATWNCIFNIESNSITGFSEFKPENIIFIKIPSSLNGADIYYISAEAFYNETLQYVILDTNIFEIDETSFGEECKIFYLGNVEDVGSTSFSELTNLYIYSETGEDLDPDFNYWHYDDVNQPEIWE